MTNKRDIQITEEDGHMQEELREDDILTAITTWQPQAIEMVYGVTISDDMPEDQYRRAMAIITSWTKAKTELIDDYKGKVLTVAGAVIHSVTYQNKQGIADRYGEVPEYINGERLIIKVVRVEGIELNNPLMISMSANVVGKDFKELYFKRYGMFNFRDPKTGLPTTLDLRFKDMRTRSGNKTYSVELVG